MAIAVVNQSTQTGALTSAGSSITIASTTVGNALVVVVQNGGNRTVSSITGLATGGYTQLHQEGPLSSTWYNSIYAAIVTSSGTSITVTMNANTADAEDRVTVFELSGVLDPIAESGTSTGAIAAAANTHTAAAVTPDTAEVFFVGVLRISGSSGGWTTDPDFTTSTAFTPTVQRVDYRIQSNTTAQSYVIGTTTARNSNIALAAVRGVLAASTVINPLSGVGSGAAQPLAV